MHTVCSKSQTGTIIEVILAAMRVNICNSFEDICIEQ